MSSVGAAPRAAVTVSSARAEASRRNGAKSRGPATPEGKARSAQNALKHGLRAQKYVVLPEEDADEFAELEAAMMEELAPVGALQTVLARRIAVAAWRLARADRIEAELFEERRFADGGLGLALIRDGNGTRSFETLLRYRGAAMAEFWRALRTLKALQAEAAGRTDRRRRACPGGAWQPSGRTSPQTKPTRTTRDFTRYDGMGRAKRARAVTHLARTPGVLAGKRTRAVANRPRSRGTPNAGATGCPLHVERTNPDRREPPTRPRRAGYRSNRMPTPRRTNPGPSGNLARCRMVRAKRTRAAAVLRR
jgi:hypothetical protein